MPESKAGPKDGSPTSVLVRQLGSKPSAQEDQVDLIIVDDTYRGPERRRDDVQVREPARAPWAHAGSIGSARH